MTLQKRTALGLYTLLFCSFTMACVTVNPSQRQILSKPEMDPNKEKLEETFHSHVEVAREAGFGGHGAAGGGCGCG